GTICSSLASPPSTVAAESAWPSASSWPNHSVLISTCRAAHHRAACLCSVCQPMFVVHRQRQSPSRPGFRRSAVFSFHFHPMTSPFVFGRRSHFGAILLLWSFSLYLPAATPSPIWRWSNPSPHGNNIVEMISTNGFAVQVCDRGQLYSSVD